MGQFRALKDFESRFKEMDISELRHWKKYWTQHAQFLQPKIGKIAMKRVYKIDKAIQLLEQEDT